MTIFIVEDDKPLRKTFTEVLREFGYRVAAAENGREALDYIRVNRPSFIFVDLVMPVMNGLELIRALKSDSELATIPIVAMTASGATEAPGIMFMKKPFSAEVAVALIEMHCDSAERRANGMSASKEIKPRNEPARRERAGRLAASRPGRASRRTPPNR
jgi:CheY-like chemotaxis protein